jgi:hypothetical protein
MPEIIGKILALILAGIISGHVIIIVGGFALILVDIIGRKLR